MVSFSLLSHSVSSTDSKFISPERPVSKKKLKKRESLLQLRRAFWLLFTRTEILEVVLIPFELESFLISELLSKPQSTWPKMTLIRETINTFDKKYFFDRPVGRTGRRSRDSKEMNPFDYPHLACGINWCFIGSGFTV